MAHEFENFKHFSALTSVGVQILALDGTSLYETDAYLAFRQTLFWLGERIPELVAQTQAAIVSGAIQSYRFGGRFFFYSPIGFFHFASPIISDGLHIATAVGGPVLMVPLEEYIAFDLAGKLPPAFDREELERQLKTIPIISPDTTNTLAEQLFVNAKHLSDPEYLGIETGVSRYTEYLLAYFSGTPSYETILQMAAEQRRENAAKKQERIVKRVIEYIEKNYSQKIKLEDAARSVYISPSYLSKLIQSRTGHSFRHLINRTRIAAAIRLLEGTDKNLSEITFLVGYEDHSYFTKIFNKHTGMNPSEYRAERRRGLRD